MCSEINSLASSVGDYVGDRGLPNAGDRLPRVPLGHLALLNEWNAISKIPLKLLLLLLDPEQQ